MHAILPRRRRSPPRGRKGTLSRRRRHHPAATPFCLRTRDTWGPPHAVLPRRRRSPPRGRRGTLSRRRRHHPAATPFCLLPPRPRRLQSLLGKDPTSPVPHLRMAGGNNQKKKKKNKKKNRPGKKETENEERNTMFQFVWGFLLLCLSSALISGVHFLNWITRMLVLLFFHLAWMCVQSGLHLLARVLSICLPSLMLVLPWTVWLFVLIEGVDLGFSSIRLIVLAVPVIMSKWFVRCMKLMVKNMWPLWMLRLLQAVANLAEQHVDNRQHGLAVDLKSVGEYLDQHPPTMSHPTYQFQIPTREGLNLWQGFLDVVLNAYEGNGSWAGTFTEEHLRMSGSECIIEMKPSYPATFENLLLDLAQLATLLLEYFQTPNLLAPRSIQQLYSSMTTPWLGPVPVPSAQQIEKFLKFMRNQPSLKPARKSNTFLSKVFQVCRAMGQNERAIIVAAVGYVIVPAGWASTVFALGYRLINRTLCHLGRNRANQVIVYRDGPEEVFRFLRNFF